MKKKILVAYATKAGATAEIAEAVADELRRAELDVDVRKVSDVKSIDEYRAVIVGSAVYFDRWRQEAVQFLRHFKRDLSSRPVWLFQDGPLESDFDESMRPLPRRVMFLADRLGMMGSVTFGGRLEEGQGGPVARSIAKTYAGDYRDFKDIQEWAAKVARILTGHRPDSARQVTA
ncbi:MAG: flavodoxin domain-containing protein [Actinomycetota bacterium]